MSKHIDIFFVSACFILDPDGAHQDHNITLASLKHCPCAQFTRLKTAGNWSFHAIHSFIPD